jgi:hypothetical protein
MPFGSSAASCPLQAPFPPEDRAAFHAGILEELLQERVASSRGRRAPRAVKRKLSKYPVRHRLPPPAPPVDFAKAVAIVK